MGVAFGHHLCETRVERTITPPPLVLVLADAPFLSQCASKVNGGRFSSSKDFPDEVLRFVRSHPVMYQPVLPQHKRPILLQTEPSRRKLTQIAVDRVQAQDGQYHVLYIGTGRYTSRNVFDNASINPGASML